MSSIDLENITIGADPEFFLHDTKIGQIVSAHNIVPGSKEHPEPLKNGVCVQSDGVAVEFNITPAKTAYEFSERIQDALSQLRQLIPDRYEFRFIPTASFTKKYLDSLPEKVTELGCSPDLLALNRGKRRFINSDLVGLYRFAGGHIHIGWGDGLDIRDTGHNFDCMCISRNLGEYFNAVVHNWDNDRVRGGFYGYGYPYRVKHYGVEYRGLSGAWLDNKTTWPFIFNSAVAILTYLTKPESKPLYYWNNSRFRRPILGLPELPEDFTYPKELPY
jgi:hypothetical protein